MILNDSLRDLPDGTYRVTADGTLDLVERNFGYWVAVQPIDLDNELVSTNYLPSDFIGVWRDSTADYRLWVDATIWIRSESVAKQIGRATNQLAIWDCAQSTEIYL